MKKRYLLLLISAVFVGGPIGIYVNNQFGVGLSTTTRVLKGSHVGLTQLRVKRYDTNAGLVTTDDRLLRYMEQALKDSRSWNSELDGNNHSTAHVVELVFSFSNWTRYTPDSSRTTLDGDLILSVDRPLEGWPTHVISFPEPIPKEIREIFFEEQR